ncbi:MAG: hypothetical protein A2Z52_00890 [Candidatus Moranbacteria bacterium RBG_19FT_COMBO_42_6]|nr:MAG: hypothetical protein A2Z52_00890 [Candidatus Moranbacteria bacterium RBG_19FT_COMBO_42_6]
MPDKKITELDELVTPQSTDILPIVDDPAGTPVTKKVQVGNLPGGGFPINAADVWIQNMEA